MIQNLLIFAPYIALTIGILHLVFLYIFHEDRAKIYSRIARFWLIISLFFGIVFYEASPFAEIFKNNAYSLLFILIIYMLIYHILGLSVSWFSSKNRTGYRFDILLLAASLVLSLLVETNNLLALFSCYVFLSIINYGLVRISDNKIQISLRSGISGIIVLGLFTTAVGYFYYELNGRLGYAELKTFLQQNQTSILCFGAVTALVLPFFYALGIAPLHITTEDKLSLSALPVSHFFAIVLPLAYLGAFIKLNIILYDVYPDVLGQIYLVFALISVIFGAIGANARINLQRIYAYSSLYHLGLVLLLLSLGHNHTDFAAFIYLFAYILSLNGAYLVFYSLKSHGEYLSSITGIAGLAETRAYATGALSVSLFSLIGIPPLIGFWGMFNFAYEIIQAKYFISLGIAFAFLLIMFKAYLEIIKTAYFEHKVRIFDTVNRWVLLYMVLNVLMITLLVFNPWHIFERIKDMFYVVFL